jgi:hypothetical protein
MIIIFAVVNLVVMGGTGLSSKAQEFSAADTPLPESDEVRGWKKTGEIRIFDAGNLWKYINGGAEKYIKVGLTKMMTAHYLYIEKGESISRVETIVDVYKMDTPEGAKATFDSELSGGGIRVELGNDARLTQNSLTFWKGPYFVRLTAFQSSSELKKALVGLGRGIEKKLK